jgi:hypothetical protein
VTLMTEFLRVMLKAKRRYRAPPYRKADLFRYYPSVI